MPRILVIDDDPTVTSVLKRGLAYEGYTVDTAAAGAQGLTIARDHTPDLVILDLMLPGIDGFEVCRRLREDPATQSLPIVMLSSRGNIKEKLAGFRAGADDYLVKEFDLLDLPYRVRLVFRLRGLETDRN